MSVRPDLIPIFRQNPQTLVSLLRHRADEQGDRVGYTFLENGESEKESWTYQQLQTKAQAIAAKLQSTASAGVRALLLYPPGLEFVSAFFGCLYAGIVAVPVYPPRQNSSLTRLENIVSDAGASMALTTSSISLRMEGHSLHYPGLDSLKWISTDTVPDELGENWMEPSIQAVDLAFLQYTSGSTGKPKGVMVSHENLLHNSAFIHDFFGCSEDSLGLSWLPQYHDMGLIGCIITPLYSAVPVILMSPVHFLQKPLRWLAAISKYKVSMSGGPNFAYDLCVNKVSPEQKEGLDLGSWKVAFNGAEPIRAETLGRFAEAFEPCGFNRKAFYPCYGLAEATLFVSGRQSGEGPTLLSVIPDALEKNRVINAEGHGEKGKVLVGCGRTKSDQRLLIVDPDTRLPCDKNTVGEIWLEGPGVAKGYWKRPEETEEIFNAAPADSGKGRFLRTGDLGFIRNGELFVTGRLKDVIIIRGLNYYPQDIEYSVEKSHEALSPGSGAAFTVEEKGQQRLVVVQELKRQFIRNANKDQVVDFIRSAVFKEHGLQTFAVVLVKPLSLPKTSSGKIRRHECKKAFLEGGLNVVYQKSGYSPGIWNQAQLGLPRRRVSEILKIPDAERRLRELELFFQEQLGKVLKISPDMIDSNSSLDTLGLDSLKVVELKTRIETEMGIALSEEALFRGASIRDFAAYVLGQIMGEHLGSNYELRAKGASYFSQGAKYVDPFYTGMQENVPPEYYLFKEYPEYKTLEKRIQEAEAQRALNPYFQVYEGINRDTAVVQGKELLNFSSYNYLGMSGDPVVTQAAKDAIERFGTSVSASRVASGERPIHRELEMELAELIGGEDCIAYVGGHATNVSTIGHLFGKHDLVIHDSLIHNSIIQGCTLSGANQMPFPHNDWKALDDILTEYRHRFRRVLIAIEGVYSMDGDIPELPRFIEVKKRHKAFLMIDEAHSIGVLGKNGRGIGEHFGVDPGEVDLWMGTLSKSFASCGGYIVGCREVIKYLKYTSPGFVYSVGMSPPSAGAALAAIRLLKNYPERVTRLQELSKFFLFRAQKKGLDTGTSEYSPVIPVIVGDSLSSMHLAQALFEMGINVQPMVYPSVPEKEARLRFFLNCTHTEEQIRFTVDAVAHNIKNCN